MTAEVEHKVKVIPAGGTTVGDLRRGLARVPREALVSLSFGYVVASWRVEAQSSPSDRPAATS